MQKNNFMKKSSKSQSQKSKSAMQYEIGTCDLFPFEYVENIILDLQEQKFGSKTVLEQSLQDFQ